MIDQSKALIYPGLDVSKLSDEDLHAKVNEISRRLVFAGHSFINQEVISQLHNLQNVIISEQYERIERERFALEDASTPKIIETEPDLKERDPKKDIPVRRDDSRKKVHIPLITKSWKKPQVGKSED